MSDSTWSIDNFIQKHRLKGPRHRRGYRSLSLFPRQNLTPELHKGIIKICARWFPLNFFFFISFLVLSNLRMMLFSIAFLSLINPNRKLSIILQNGNLISCKFSPKPAVPQLPNYSRRRYLLRLRTLCDTGGYVQCIVMGALLAVTLHPDEYWKFDPLKLERHDDSSRLRPFQLIDQALLLNHHHHHHHSYFTLRANEHSKPPEEKKKEREGERKGEGREGNTQHSKYPNTRRSKPIFEKHTHHSIKPPKNARTILNLRGKETHNIKHSLSPPQIPVISPPSSLLGEKPVVSLFYTSFTLPALRPPPVDVPLGNISLCPRLG